MQLYAIYMCACVTDDNYEQELIRKYGVKSHTIARLAKIGVVWARDYRIRLTIDKRLR